MEPIVETKQKEYLQEFADIEKIEILKSPSNPESEFPKRFSQVEILYNIYTPNKDKILVKEDNPENPEIFKIGDSSQPKYIHKCLLMLQVGEKSIFEIPEKYTKNENLNFLEKSENFLKKKRK